MYVFYLHIYTQFQNGGTGGTTWLSRCASFHTHIATIHKHIQSHALSKDRPDQKLQPN